MNRTDNLKLLDEYVESLALKRHMFAVEEAVHGARAQVQHAAALCHDFLLQQRQSFVETGHGGIVAATLSVCLCSA